jgi:hypothetical protein
VQETFSDGTDTRNEVSYTDAKEVCASTGARICTAPEMESGFTRGTGCSLDTKLIWTQTPCAENEQFCAAGKTIRIGRGNEANGDIMPVGRTMPTKEVFGVRCCADRVAAPSAPPTEPRLSGLSARPCVQLARDSRDWGQAFVYRAGQSAVCASSTIDNDCHRDSATDRHSEADAVDVCTSVGARLCTEPELLGGLAKGTGCGLDNEAVWSATPCTVGAGAGFIAVTGGGVDPLLASSVCLDPEDGSASVRCCADRVVNAAAVGSSAAIDGDGSASSSNDENGASASTSATAVITGLLVAAILVLAVAVAVFRKHAQTTRSTKTTTHELHEMEHSPTLQSAAWSDASQL